MSCRLRVATLGVAALIVAGRHPAQAQTAATTRPVIVRDAVTGAPLEHVTLQTRGGIVTTDRRGAALLRVGDDTTTVVVRRIGYRAQRLRADALGLPVQLEPEPVLLTTLEVAAPAVEGELAAASALPFVVADRAQLEASGATTLARQLEGVEGIASSSPGTWGAKTVLRGMGGERLAVLLDGARLNRACTFGMDGGLATMAPGTVERVEVLAGPGSTLYGSGNIGGVINVVTRTAPPEEGWHGEVRSGASSAVPGGILGGSLWWRRGAADLGISLDGSAYGDFRNATGTVGGSSFRDLTASVRGGLDLGAHRVGASVQRYVGRDIGYPGSNALIPEEDRLSLNADWGWRVGGGVVENISAKAFRQQLDHVMQVTMAGTNPMGQPMTSTTDATSRTVTSGVRGQVRLRPWSGLRIETGSEVTVWDAEATRLTQRGSGPMATTVTLRSWPGVTLVDLGVFSQGELSLTRAIAVSAGLRGDHIRNAAEAQAATTEFVWTGNVGARAALGAGFSARTSVGWGYRVPDPTELFGLAIRPDGFIYEGNAALRTETSRNVEASLGWAGGVGELSVTVYRNDLSGLISPVRVDGATIAGLPVRRYENLAEARVQGVSGSGMVEPVRGVQVRVTASWLEGDNRTAGQPLPMMPPFEGTGAVRVQPRGTWWVEVEGRGAAQADRAALAQGEIVTPGWAIGNVRGGVQMARTNFTVGVDNVFDKLYRTHLDAIRLQLPGRNVYLRLSRGF